MMETFAVHKPSECGSTHCGDHVRVENYLSLGSETALALYVELPGHLEGAAVSHQVLSRSSLHNLDSEKCFHSETSPKISDLAQSVV